jgi:hypothetical protein
MRRVKQLPSTLLVMLLASALDARGADPVTEKFPIVADTQIDSRDPTRNFGVSTAVKVVVNGNDGSLARVLFRLPDEALAIEPEQVVAARVWFYVWLDNTADRTVVLHPLARSFVEGSGSATASGDGATWLTSDGVNAWSTPGGDDDEAVVVVAEEAGNWFSWDVASLWSDENLRANGALLKMNDESAPGVGEMPRAPFTSSEGPANQQPYVEITYIAASACDAHVSWADADGDDDIDQVDFAIFQTCRSESGLGGNDTSAWCECFDRDLDTRVTSADLDVLIRCATGPSVPVDPATADAACLP